MRGTIKSLEKRKVKFLFMTVASLIFSQMHPTKAGSGAGKTGEQPVA